MDPYVTTAAIIVGDQIITAAHKVLGPTYKEIGEGFKNLWKGKKLILDKASQKCNIESEGRTNLRVTRDVFWNGSFSEDELSAEYFGGILASSRSIDGKDDSSIYYLDLIKSLSSKQIHLHYIIYNLLRKEILKYEEFFIDLKIESPDSLKEFSLYLNLNELTSIGDIIIPDFWALEEKGLITFDDSIMHLNYISEAYETDVKGETFYDDSDNSKIKMVKATPLGIMLFMQAYNLLNDYLKYVDPKCKIKDFKNIKLPKHIKSTRIELSGGTIQDLTYIDENNFDKLIDRKMNN